MTDFATYDTVLDCGCGLATGRCEDHAAKMRALAVVYHAAVDGGADADRFHRIGAMVDGFGLGLNYGDWSAWRDSTIDAIDTAFAAIDR